MSLFRVKIKFTWFAPVYIPMPPDACPSEEDLTVLTDSLSAMRLLQSMQRKYFPLSLYRRRDSVRQLLLHVVKLIDQRAAAGSITRLIKVRAHRGKPLNEAADARLRRLLQSRIPRCLQE